MTREQVIKGMKCCLRIHQGATLDESCNICPYQQQRGKTCDATNLFADALALLKEQEVHSVCTKENCPMNANTISDDCNVKTCPWRTEAFTPKVSMGGLWYECSTCGRHLTKDIDHYCPQCGKAVKWNDTGKAD
jgi:hypothetical protein